jgi:multisubunit Na+/H+ antiporter MnhG subunit
MNTRSQRIIPERVHYVAPDWLRSAGGRLLLVLALFVFTSVLGYAVMNGQFRQDGAALLDNPWGIMTLVDLYIGLALFACFIWANETDRVRAVCWILALLVLGNLIALIYLLRWAISRAGDDPEPDRIKPTR